MESKMKRSGRSVMKGSNYSRRSGSRNKDSASSSSTISTVDAAAIATGTSKNALRERTRVESLRRAYLELQAAIPSVPPNTKLSKLDVLVLATTYISHLTQLLQEDDARNSHDANNNNNTCNSKEVGGIREGISSSNQEFGLRKVHQKGLLHPVKKWPMRARLYADVGATDAVNLLGEQPKAAPQQFQPRLEHVHPSTQPCQPFFQPCSPTQPSLTNGFYHPVNPMPCKQQSLMAHFNSCSGMLEASTDKFGISHTHDFYGKPSPRSHFHAGRFGQYDQSQRYGGQHCVPASSFPGCTNSWEPDHGWTVPYMTHNEFNACPSQCNMTQHGMPSYGGCWSAWNA